MVVFSKIELSINGKVIFLMENTTLPDATAAAKLAGIDTINNFAIVVSCYY